MAVLTTLSLPEARALGARWGLDVSSVRGIPAGSVNSNFELSLADGTRVFMRIYEEQGARSAAGEARLLEHLSAGGVPTPRPLSLVGEPGFIVEHVGKPVALFPWVLGEALCQKRVTSAHAGQVGQALGSVHRVGETFHDAPQSRFRAGNLLVRLEEIEAGERTAEVAAAARLLRARVEQQLRRPPGPQAPLIHGDLFRDNVLWSQGCIAALLDFESASRGSCAFDLMVTVLAWCFGDALDLDLCRALVAGYASARPLSGAEVATLYDEALFAAVRFSITRITDFELRPAGTGVYKDFRRFLARLRAIEEIGPARWPSALGV